VLCEPRDADALASAVARVLDSPDEAERMRNAGLARAAEFSWDKTAQSFAVVLDEVLA
jgi:glycosyltransferase involved in cell wall biosynthesis